MPVSDAGAHDGDVDRAQHAPRRGSLIDAADWHGLRAAHWRGIRLAVAGSFRSKRLVIVGADPA